jgi:hypothetical protein
MSPTQMHDAEILERIRELFRKWIEDEVSPGQVFDGLSILLKEPYKKPEEWSPPDIWWASKEQVDARVDEKVRDVVREILEEERSRRGEIWWEVPLDSPLWAGQRTDHGIEPTAASGRGVATDEYARQKLAENKRSLQLVGHRIKLVIFNHSGKRLAEMTYPASHQDVRWVVETLIPVPKVAGEMSGVGFEPPREVRLIWGVGLDRSVHVYTRV